MPSQSSNVVEANIGLMHREERKKRMYCRMKTMVLESLATEKKEMLQNERLALIPG